MAGLIAWHELYTSDVDSATRFYTELLGAELETASMGDFEYPMLKKDGVAQAGFARNEHAEIPSHWYPYVQVDDVDATVDRATAAGAELHHGPADVSDDLRLAVLGDPQGATFGVMRWSAERPEGLVAWDELYAADVEAAARFYGALFGWTTSPFADAYQLFDLGEANVGGLMRKPEELPAALWNVYFATGDVDASTSRAQELGAAVMLPPTRIEGAGVGRFSVLGDPTGAMFGLFQPDA